MMVAERQIGAIGFAQNAPMAHFVGALERYGEREPLIGVGFSDSSRGLLRGFSGARIRKPRESSRICQG
jgi:hypothetical protein